MFISCEQGDFAVESVNAYQSAERPGMPFFFFLTENLSLAGVP